MKKTNNQDDKKNDETIMYKPMGNKKIKMEKEKKPKKSKKHKKLRRIIKIIAIMMLILMVIVGGIAAAIIYRCIWGDWAITEEDIQIRFENTTMYDKDGNNVATVAGSENREIISKDEMSPYLFQAFISIEDERFEDHHRS